jgi:hypothetical protein
VAAVCAGAANSLQDQEGNKQKIDANKNNFILETA